MRKFGLIGYPLTHSFSKKYFTEKFEKEHLADCVYEMFEIPNINLLPELFASEPNLIGLNVTIPYKLQVLPYLDELDPACAAIGAVNTIKIKDGKRFGYNTDYFGFKASLESWLGESRPGALVLGTGGASKAVCQALQALKMSFKKVSRTNRHLDMDLLTYGDLHENTQWLEQYPLVINTTPVGTYPNIEDTPDLPFEQISNKNWFYDLVYNPETTATMTQMAKRGAKAKNGLEMLQLQAEASWEIWNR